MTHSEELLQGLASRREPAAAPFGTFTSETRLL